MLEVNEFFTASIFQIKGAEGGWYTLPTPLAVKPSENVLDSENSGRDNSTGLMFRDIVGRKAKYTFTLPAGIDNVDGARITNIILGESFQCYVPDIFTGQWAIKTFYNANCGPEIEKITRTGWTYKEWTFTATEM